LLFSAESLTPKLEKISLLKIDFHDTESSALFRRMTSPVINPDTDGFVPDPPLRNIAETENLPSEQYHDNAVFNVLVPDDIPPISDEETVKAVAANLHGKCGSIRKITLDEDLDEDIWKNLPRGESVLIIQEGWQPCTMEYLDYLKAMRQVLNERQLTVVGLIGQYPQNKNKVSGFTEELYRDWHYRLVNLRDPALESIRLVIGDGQ
jgi:hypothetical protein